MAPKPKTLEGIGKNVASFLVSAKDGRTPGELEADYEELFHKPIPYAEIGVRGILDVLLHLQSEGKARPGVRGGRWVVGKVAGAEKLTRMVQMTKTTARTGRMAPSSQPSRRGGPGRGLGRGGSRATRSRAGPPFPSYGGHAVSASYSQAYFMPPQRAVTSSSGSSFAQQPASAGPSGPGPGAPSHMARCDHCGSSVHNGGQCPNRVCPNCGQRGDGHGPMGCPKSCCLCFQTGHKGKECPRRCRACMGPQTSYHLADACPHLTRSPSASRVLSQSGQPAQPSEPSQPSQPSARSLASTPPAQLRDGEGRPLTATHSDTSFGPPPGLAQQTDGGWADSVGRWCVSCSRRVGASHAPLICPVCVLCRGPHSGQACPERFPACSSSCQASFARPRHDEGCVAHLCAQCGSAEHRYSCPQRWCLLCDEAPARHDALRCPKACPLCRMPQPQHLGRDCPLKCDDFPMGFHHEGHFCLAPTSTHYAYLPEQLKPKLTPHLRPPGLRNAPFLRGGETVAAKSPSSAEETCGACGSAGHSTAGCPNLTCKLCGEAGRHGTLQCPLACCFCLRTDHVGRFCPVDDFECASKAKPSHTLDCVERHLTAAAFDFTGAAPDPRPLSAASLASSLPGASDKPRSKGRGRAQASSSTASSPLPGGAQFPVEPSKDTVDLNVQKVVWEAGEEGLTLNELRAAYQRLCGRDLEEDVTAVGYKALTSLISRPGPLTLWKKRLLLHDPEGFRRLMEELQPCPSAEDPGLHDLTFDDVRFRLQSALTDLEEAGQFLPVTRLAWGLEIRSDPAREKQILGLLNEETADESQISLFVFREPQANSQSKSQAYCLALKPLEELLRQLEAYLLSYRPAQGRVSGEQLRRWWLMEPHIPGGPEKEQIFTDELQNPAKDWHLRMRLDVFPTDDAWGSDYEVCLGVGGDWDLRLQDLPPWARPHQPIPVTVSHVVNGGEFHVRCRETEAAFGHLSEHLTKFMRKMGELDYLWLRPDELRPGELVALRSSRPDGSCFEWDGRRIPDEPGQEVWWRGVLVGSRSFGGGVMAAVRLVDLGNEVLAPLDAVRRLPWVHQLRLPAQAIRCHWSRLVADPAGHWAADSGLTLRESVLERGRPFELLALWSGHFTEDESAMFLVDVVRQEEDGYEASVARELKHSGFAQELPDAAHQRRPQAPADQPSPAPRLATYKAPTGAAHKPAASSAPNSRSQVAVAKSTSPPLPSEPPEDPAPVALLQEKLQLSREPVEEPKKEPVEEPVERLSKEEEDADVKEQDKEEKTSTPVQSEAGQEALENFEAWLADELADDLE